MPVRRNPRRRSKRRCHVDEKCPEGYDMKDLTEVADICGVSSEGNEKQLCGRILKRMKEERDSGGESEECSISDCESYDRTGLVELATRCGIEIMKSDRRKKTMDDLCRELKEKG
jgi:hypothetical protein